MSPSSQWPKVPVGDFTEVVTGGTPSTSIRAYWEGGAIPWLNSGELNKGVIVSAENHITRLGLENSAAAMMPRGTVLIALTGATTGVSALLEIEACANQSVTGILPSSHYDSHFLIQYLRTIRQRIVADSWGGAQKHISQAYVKSLTIPLPPLLEQRRIAEVLDRAEALRAKRRAALARLDILAPSIFLDMFGDPAKNPKGWPRAALGDVIFSASDGPHVSPVYANEGVPFVSTRHVRAGEITWEDLKFISHGAADVHWKKCKPERGDILYTKGGTTGLAALVKTDQPFAVWVHVALLKPDPAKVSSVWLELMLNSAFCYRQSQVLTHGIANRDLGLKRMVRISIFLPPLSLQREFASRVTAVESLKAVDRTSLAKLDVLFASLQRQAFHGDLWPTSSHLPDEVERTT
jgi:type I restriction enzyme S subunit